MATKPKKKKTGTKAKPGDKRLGNQFWKFRTRHGPKMIFSDPTILWNECLNYFQYCEDNPLQEEKVFHNSGEITRTTVSHIRAMTIQGLCFYLKISYDAWKDYRNHKDLGSICREAEQTIYNQKFSGAAADLLNANIIARDLGLKDKQDVNHSYPSSIKIRYIDSEPKKE